MPYLVLETNFPGLYQKQHRHRVAEIGHTTESDKYRTRIQKNGACSISQQPDILQQVPEFTWSKQGFLRVYMDLCCFLPVQYRELYFKPSVVDFLSALTF